VRIAVKLMNARFDDDFQLAMMAACTGAGALVVFNRLFDAERGVAYGGWDLSERNLRVLDAIAPRVSAGPPNTPGSPPLTPGLRPLTPGLRPLTPGLRPLTPGLRPLTPGLRPLTPGLRPGLCGTGNICSGRLIVDYARRGCESVQLHTFFQLPLSEYAATRGSRTQRALHALVFHPSDGLVAAMLELEAAGELERRDGA